VEDESKLCRALREGLEAADYVVATAATGEEGCFLVLAESFDLVLLDVMLPGRSGLDVLRALRGRRLMTPVLLLTAKDAIEDRLGHVARVVKERQPACQIATEVGHDAPCTTRLLG
jgi:DNA-binding response OmpR family regulator